MRVGIICAGDREVAPFLPVIHDCKMTEKAMLKFYEGKISDVAPNILTEFHPWLETVFFKADQGLLNAAKAAVDKLEQSNKVFWGRMVTGEMFITDEGRQMINEQFEPLTVDMETAGIAHVCHVNNIPFLSVRSITDTATHSGVGHFEENCEKASMIARDITVAILTEIHKQQ